MVSYWHFLVISYCHLVSCCHFVSTIVCLSLSISLFCWRIPSGLVTSPSLSVFTQGHYLSGWGGGASDFPFPFSFHSGALKWVERESLTLSLREIYMSGGRRRRLTSPPLYDWGRGTLSYFPLPFRFHSGAFIWAGGWGIFSAELWIFVGWISIRC